MSFDDLAGVAGNVFDTAGRQTRSGAGRHPQDQQGETASTGVLRGADHGSHRLSVGVRRADRRVQVHVRTVCRPRGLQQYRRRSGRDGRSPARSQLPLDRHVHYRWQSDGHRASGQAQTVHVRLHRCVQPGVLRRVRPPVRLVQATVCRNRSQQPGVSTVLAHDARKRVQPAPTTIERLRRFHRHYYHHSIVMIITR